MAATTENFAVTAPLWFQISSHVRNFWQGFNNAQKSNHNVEAYQALSDHQLTDIGLIRDAIVREFGAANQS